VPDLLAEVNARVRDLAGSQSAGSKTAREVSRDLREESLALREQARLKAERARRNVDPAARRLELVCGSCGYGVSVARPPERCPMCSGWDWRRARPR
jgi:rubrerythrin